tara:strand:+ start:94 stop:303 length:210 start_codon:yes stop_codon:yes gene_type:complete
MANITKGGISTTEYILPSDEKKTKDFLPVQPKYKRELSETEKERMKKALKQRMERESGAGYSGTEDYKQ